MNNICVPLCLPNNIERSYIPSCESKYDCHPKIMSNSNTDFPINNAFSSQSNYKNKSKNTIFQTPTLEIAYLSNVRTECEADINIVLNPTTLTWCDFLTLFYNTNNVFNINPINENLYPISFLNQTYENTTSEKLKFNLAHQVRMAWASKYEISINNIPPKTNIMLNKDTFGIRSLINASLCVSLTLDQAIETLLSNGEIATGDSSNSASVNFVIQYKYYFKPLNTGVLVKFIFMTHIPCYKNINICDEWCPPYSEYSNDKHCRNCGDLTDETMDIMNYLNKNFKNDTDSFFDDKSDINYMDSINGSLADLKEFENYNDENTEISMASSNW
jgi:hypothetical protein